jgi:flagellar hook-associated protein 1 FlgK
MLDTMNTIIPGISGQLDEVAKSLANSVNGLVTTGFDIKGDPGGPMFTGANARDIKVAIDDPDKVAFSAGNPKAVPPAVAAIDNDKADDLAALGNSQSGPDQVYQQMIGQLGVASQASARRAEIQDAVRDQVDTSREAESGVNLDEEMTNLLTFQRGYEAASRVLTTIDSMLDQLINRTGLVGR